MLRGGPPRLYNEDQKAGYRDERPPNRHLANGRDFGGGEAAAYLLAHERYAGRFFGRLKSTAPNFWKELPSSIEIIFVSGLYGLVFWDEPIQDYDCHLADYFDDMRRAKVSNYWAGTLSEALIDYLRIQSRSAPITAVYDLLSERIYQSLFSWEKIQGAAVYHRIFKGVSGPDILTGLARILATTISGFSDRTYKQGEWYELTDSNGPLQFGFESRLDHDPAATREGDIEKVENRLFKEQPWLTSLAKPLRDSMVLAELSWRKVEDWPKYEWGGIAVSFVKPVEHFLRIGKETLGEVAARVRGDPALRPIYPQLQRLNGFFIRAKHFEPPPVIRSDVPIVRSLAFEILRFAIHQRR